MDYNELRKDLIILVNDDTANFILKDDYEDIQYIQDIQDIQEIESCEYETKKG
jgi:hypothetical protein